MQKSKIQKPWLMFGIILMLPFLLVSCFSFYQKMNKFQGFAESGDFEKADEALESAGKTDEGRNRILYFFNKGWTQHMRGEEESSNNYFNQADEYMASYEQNYALDALAFLSNPTIKPYKPESIENIMVNYYKAMNYLQINDKEGALVEARKIVQKLYEQNDLYKDKQNRYSDDAFAQTIAGLIYDASGDFNNAFIAYRNAVKVYEEVFQPHFGISAPLQLKEDLLRTAYLSGMSAEVQRFEKKFDMVYKPVSYEAQLVFFWENGFGPVKDQWSINFTKVRSDGGFVTFANQEMGLSFPIFIGDMSSDERSGFSQLEFFRIAFPKYVARNKVLNKATLTLDNETYPLHLAQDINSISFQVLQDRMLRELATAIARFAAKKATEALIRHQNQDVGTAVGILNALTETADTRNWQTLPYDISYCRVPLKTGNNTVQFEALGATGLSEKQSLELTATKGQTIFFNYRSLASYPAGVR